MPSPRSQPHPLALFSLVPKTRRAEEVVTRPCNNHFVSMQKGGELALDIGHVRSKSEDNNTLATLGRDGDIFVDGASIARI